LNIFDYGLVKIENGCVDFQNTMISGHYQENSNSLIFPEAVTNPNFLYLYRNSANGFAKYNKTNNIGNEAQTNVLPFSLIKLIRATYYGKK